MSSKGSPSFLPTTNGSAKGKHATYAAPRRRTAFVPWLTSLITKLAIWYSVVTILLQCPRDISDLTDTSPRICKPYLQLQSLATPYVQPYYHAYLEPHVAKVQPYVNQANTKFVQPAATFAQTNYVKYGSPQVTRAQKVAKKQWTKHVVPQLTSVRNKAFDQYSATLGPHIKKVDDVVRPYYTGITTSASDLWELEIRPAYKLVSPYFQKVYIAIEKFVVNILVPNATRAGDAVWTGLHRHVFPTLKVLYGENVEPQIMRIKQRLGRYRDEKKIEAAVSSLALSSTSSPTFASTSTTKSSSRVSVATTTTSTSSTAISSSTVQSSSIVQSSSTVQTTSAATSSSTVQPAAPSPKKGPSELFADAHGLWERQVSRAVEQGAEHLQERISDICNEQIAHQVKNVGDALLIQLEEAEKHAVSGLKKAIQTSVSSLPEDATSEDVTEASKEFDNKVREAGNEVREKAKQIRTWRKQFDIETTDLVEAAANSTLETIDNIRELRLQDIGRRWASHDDLSHKDWSKYNHLKRTSSQWRDSIVEIVL